jgi:hypothetical protein
VKCVIDGAVPDSASVWLEASRLLDDGDAASAMQVLREMARLYPVRDHVR